MPPRWAELQYPDYLPIWNPTLKCPILGPFEHYEHARDADPSMPDLLSQAKVTHLTPATGTEVSGTQSWWCTFFNHQLIFFAQGIQLASLSNEGMDQLSLLCAQRKVLAFRDQNFKDLSISQILDWCAYYGRPSIHPVGPTPAKGDHPEIHIAHSGGPDARLSTAWSRRTTSMNWHVDGSVDAQPPGLVFLYLLESPPTGGDTVFCNTAELYRRLSPEFSRRLHGLRAEHSDIDLVERTKANSGVVKRDGITNTHPIVRNHPVTGENAVFVNPICEWNDFLLASQFGVFNTLGCPHNSWRHTR